MRKTRQSLHLFEMEISTKYSMGKLDDESKARYLRVGRIVERLSVMFQDVGVSPPYMSLHGDLLGAIPPLVTELQTNLKHDVS